MASDTTSVRALIETLRAGYPEVGSLDLRLHDCGARVHSNSRALLDVLSAYFHDFVANGATGEPEIVVTAIECPPIDTGHAYAAWPPGPGKTRVKDEYVDFPDGRLMRKRLTRMLFCFGAAGNVAAGACLENSNQVVNFVNNRFIQRQVDRGLPALPRCRRGARRARRRHRRLSRSRQIHAHAAPARPRPGLRQQRSPARSA